MRHVCSFMARPSIRRLMLFTSTAVWLAGVCFGMRHLLEYSYTPGIQLQSGRTWPTTTALSRSRAKATLVLAVHPHCPCTRATLNELAVIVARCSGKIRAEVLLYRPSGFNPGWSDTDLRQTAMQIPGVIVVDDPDGVEAQRFGAATSGETLLYDQAGRLLFKGGITASRGHSGDNLGRDTVIDVVTSGVAGLSSTPVFGCSLRSTAAARAERNGQIVPLDDTKTRTMGQPQPARLARVPEGEL
jgi:hypothetical protein